ncbi:MAG TPA: hypothetical protein VNH18_25635 [Bryobacteraceae bacterium]|nr:hypothetical protein [Bryobacteraceae bacterium]
MGKGDYAGALDYFHRTLALLPKYYALAINLGVANGAIYMTPELKVTSDAQFNWRRARRKPNSFMRAGTGRIPAFLKRPPTCASLFG